MATLHLLGTGAAISDATRTTTMLAFAGETVIVVDCGGDVVQRLLLAGIDLDRIEALILTHEHPDHVGGFPLFMEKIWLSGRRRPIHVLGPERALDQAKRIFSAFDTSGWHGMPNIEWTPIHLDEHVDVWISSEWYITASPGKHSVPVIGLRVKSMSSGRVVVYSADTARCESIADLARGADILVHEATGKFAGHVTLIEAARIAREAGANRLIVVHLPPKIDEDELKEARRIMEDIDVGRDGDRVIC